MGTAEHPDTGEQQYMSTEQLASEIENINDNVKSEEPMAVDGVKERIQQKVLRMMNSVQLANDLTALEQLDESLNAAENLFTSMNKSNSLTHLETVTNALGNKKNKCSKEIPFYYKKKGSKNKKLGMRSQHKMKNKSYLMFTILIHIRLLWQR